MRSLCGFAASRAESLWLSVALQRGRGFASGGVAAKRSEVLTESLRLSAREAAKPQHGVGKPTAPVSGKAANHILLFSKTPEIEFVASKLMLSLQSH